MFRIFILVFALLCSPDSVYAKKKTLTDAIQDKAEELTTQAPKDMEVCFSPEEPCDIKLWKLIQSATKSLDVAVYDLTHPKIVHEILVASKRIPVRVVVDRRQSKGEHSLVSTLLRAGANVRYGSQRGVMHNKFAIVDGGMLETGSFNYTYGAAEKNNENQIYIGNPAVIARYQARFDELWKKGKPASQVVSHRK